MRKDVFYWSYNGVCVCFSIYETLFLERKCNPIISYIDQKFEFLIITSFFETVYLCVKKNYRKVK